MDLSDKSTDELKNTLKTLQTISYILAIVIFLLFCFTIYGLIFIEKNSTFIALFAVGISCSAILPLQFSSIKKIKTELKSRE